MASETIGNTPNSDDSTRRNKKTNVPRTDTDLGTLHHCSGQME